MTAIAEEPAVKLHPGWNIVAELMPPEILAGRQATVIRRLMLIGLAGLLIVCVLAYAAVRLAGLGASSDLKKADARTVQLQTQQHSYDNVVRIKAQIAAAGGELATVMATNTDAAKAIVAVINAAPVGTGLTQLSLAVTGSSTTGGAAAINGASSLDTGTLAHTGSVVLTGIARHLPDVATYLDNLSTIPGIVIPYPGTSSIGPHGVNFSIQLTLTSVLHSDRFDTSKDGK